MGKRRGAAIRAKKRADAAALELADAQIEHKELARFEAKPDDELFVIDTIAPKPSKTALIKANDQKARGVKLSQVKQSKRNRISEKDERQVKKLMEIHSKEKIMELAKGDTVRQQKRKKAKRVAGTSSTDFDLWGTKEETVIRPVSNTGVAPAAGTAPIQFQTVLKSSLRKDIQQPAVLSKRLQKDRRIVGKRKPLSIRVEKAQPGQSYRPDEEQHQDVIGEALSIELKRKEALEAKQKPVGGGGLSEETLALMVGSSDDESSDEDEDSEVEVDTNQVVKKRQEKLTRAQRNKRKRVKAQEVNRKERKRAKKLLDSIQDVRSIAKNLRKEDAEKYERRKEIHSLKEEEKNEPSGKDVFEKLANLDPLHTPSLPVALSSELKDGSLRTVKPKGNLLTDRMESLISRNMANRRNIKKKNLVQGKKRKLKSSQKLTEYMLD